jgi:hypothetical protein
MKKKHLIALADALRHMRPPHENKFYGIQWDQWDLDVKAVAAVCAAFNPGFNHGRWLGYIAGKGSIAAKESGHNG